MFDYIKKLLFGAKNAEEGPLNLYQYKFLRYKKERESAYPLSLSKAHVPSEEGLVSVVLPVFNGGDILSESIESVLCQTYGNFELIIINDGSKDDTLKIANAFAERDSRIRVFDQENRKIPRTLSRGFSEARGEFLTWTSADNIMDRNFLEKMVGELKNNPETAMVYANMRLIDAKGKKLARHGWYEFPIGSGNVIFPNNAYELNTYANNTIGAAFMYRAAACEILGCYSSFKHTLEDYDYWMRMNNLLCLKHTSFTEPVYSYRWHDNSLTAKDKELGITKNRYKLMVLDDFRRDFCLSPLLWYVKSTPENKEIAELFCAAAKRAGHIILKREDFSDLFFGTACSSLCYISFGGEKADVSLPRDCKKICVGGTGDGFDMYAQIGGAPSALENGKKQYSFDDAETLFSFADAKMKNDILYGLERRIEEEEEYSKKLSVVLCTHKMTDTLSACLEALCSQSASFDDYEIVFVSNNPKCRGLKELVQKIGKKFENADISYVTAPIGGLSYARNCGMWAARGEYILYVDDDAIADKDAVAETIRGFEENSEFGVIGGRIKLTVPETARALVTENTISLWSNLCFDGDGVRRARDYGEFPYGANFAVRTQCLRRIGGFRCSYGRVGDNFGGGEETLVCFMMDTIGMGVGLNPLSCVEHRVAEDRFTLEHIEKTAYSGIMTQYRLRRDLYAPADWNDVNVRERAERAEKRADGFPEGSADFVYFKALARAFRDVLMNRRCDYDFLSKRGK